MKSKILLFVLVLCCSALACQSSEIPPTAIVVSATETSVPPTDTPEPSPTPITYPEVLDQTFSNVSVLYKDDFDYEFQEVAPDGWASVFGNPDLYITKDSNVNITARENGVGGVFHFAEKTITPGEGVSFAFQYMFTGKTLGNTFTWGLDNVNAQGEFFGSRTDGYYSFAMQMLDKNLSAHVIEGPYLKDDLFKGDLKLIEGVWYNIVLAFDKEHNYIIKIWDPHNPQNQLFYIRNWQNSPTSYYFISWIAAERELWIDEFTIFSFDHIIQ